MAGLSLVVVLLSLFFVQEYEASLWVLSRSYLHLLYFQHSWFCVYFYSVIQIHGDVYR